MGLETGFRLPMSAQNSALSEEHALGYSHSTLDMLCLTNAHAAAQGTQMLKIYANSLTVQQSRRKYRLYWMHHLLCAQRHYSIATSSKSIRQLLQKARVLPGVPEEQGCKSDMCRYPEASEEQITVLTLPGSTSCLRCHGNQSLVQLKFSDNQS